jgi:hypothetical protein
MEKKDGGERFRIDERVGCMAVIDTDVPYDSPGLHCDSKHVVAYWHGSKNHVDDWEIPHYFITQAKNLCDMLNEYDAMKKAAVSKEAETDDERRMEKLLMDKLEVFKRRIKEAAEDVSTNLYTDVLPYVVTDTQLNAAYLAESALNNFLRGSKDEIVRFPWRDKEVAMMLYDANKDRIESAIIDAMAEKIGQLNDRIEDFYKSRL